MSPIVSVVIPVYNAARYIRSAIASIQSQTFSDFEIIAVDDGSTDNSKAILDALLLVEPRLSVISRPNTGIVGALNDGLAVARGEFIARMDADDVSLPERFARQVAHLRAHPNCVAVGSAFIYIDEAGAWLKECSRPADHATLERDLLAGNGGALIHPSVMFRTAAVRAAGGYREFAQWVEDLDLYLRLAQMGHLANLPDVLFHYRFHEQSVNFTRNQGRHERKLAVLAEAHALRELSFDPAAHPPPAAISGISSDDLRDFAVSSLRFGRLGRPWHYVAKGLCKDPFRRQSWRTFMYVAKSRLGFISPAA